MSHGSTAHASAPCWLEQPHAPPSPAEWRDWAGMRESLAGGRTPGLITGPQGKGSGVRFTNARAARRLGCVAQRLELIKSFRALRLAPNPCGRSLGTKGTSMHQGLPQDLLLLQGLASLGLAPEGLIVLPSAGLVPATTCTAPCTKATWTRCGVARRDANRGQRRVADAAIKTDGGISPPAHLNLLRLLLLLGLARSQSPA